MTHAFAKCAAVGEEYPLASRIVNYAGIFLNFYVIYLLSFYSKGLFTSYRRLLLALTISDVASHIWSSVILQPVYTAQVTLVNGPVGWFGLWTLNVALAIDIFLIAANFAMQYFVFLYRFVTLIPHKGGLLRWLAGPGLKVVGGVLCALTFLIALLYWLSAVSVWHVYEYVEDHYKESIKYVKQRACIITFHVASRLTTATQIFQTLMILAMEVVNVVLFFKMTAFLKKPVVLHRTYVQQRQMHWLLSFHMFAQILLLVLPLVVQGILTIFIRESGEKDRVFYYFASTCPLANAIVTLFFISPLRRWLAKCFSKSEDLLFEKRTSQYG